MIYNFTTERGTDMVARLVLEDGRYGRDGCLIADSPMVEFYSVTEHKFNNTWLREMYGLDRGLYFISRYNLDTFLFGYCRSPAPVEVGVLLDGGDTRYSLTARECRDAACHLFYQLGGMPR